MFSKLLFKLKIVLYNLFTMIYTTINKRDSNIVIIGAWMGLKFTDNSRYLYQYLYDNKYLLNLKKVIWVTDNIELNDELNDMGYESYMFHTKESRYWHLKAGIHIICNSAIKYNNFSADIETQYSWGAKKIQLWHGIGMKSVGIASNLNNNESKNIMRKLYYLFHLNTLCNPGGWNKCIYLCTSDLDVEIHKRIFPKCVDNQFLVSGYPRNCECIRYMKYEIELIEQIKKSEFAILYLPTFRSSSSQYVHPMKSDKFIKFINENNILWIEKLHTASTFDYKDINVNSKNVILLDSNFDINTLYEYTDIVISDYSSAVLDGIYKKIPTIMYASDLENFKNNDVGFLYDIEEYFKDIIVYNIDECIDLIKEIINNKFFTDKRLVIYNQTIKSFFKDSESDYNKIWKDINKIE